MRWTTWGPILSILAHAGIAAAVLAIPKGVAKKGGLVAVVDKKKDDKKKDEPAKADEPPPPPPKPIQAPRAAPKPRPAVENTPPPSSAPAASPAVHAALAALPNLGISMAGGPGGVGIGPVGPVGGDPGAAPRPAAEAPRVVKPKDDCAEDAVKPKLAGAIAQDRIIAAAQAAGGVEGRIRLELLVDEAGNVTSVRVTSGLGGAIDEAAVSAAKRVKLTPSTRCGRPVAGRLVVAITVRNPD